MSIYSGRGGGLKFGRLIGLHIWRMYIQGGEGVLIHRGHINETLSYISLGANTWKILLSIWFVKKIPTPK